MKSVLWFEDVDKKNITQVGGKGANLGKMAADFPIPSGFVITAESFQKVIKDLNIRDQIENLLKDIDVDDSEQLQNVSNEIKDIFLSKDIPKSIQSDYLDAFDQLSQDEEIFTAVRSSATAEDLPQASFAGQQDTFLGVNKKNLIESVKKCWASLYTPRAIYYREMNGFDHMEVAIAVIVQKLIDSKIAGVAFSRDPSTGEDQVLIEAGLGLGDTVVGGEITPDTYIIDPQTWSITNKSISKQEFKLVREGNKTEEVELNDLGQQQKLEDDKVIQLAKLCRDIEEFYDGEPQDIEWAYVDQFYIIQSRPITTIDNDSSSEVIEDSDKQILVKGLGASPGRGSGKAHIVLDTDKLSSFREGEVLVTDMTSPDWVPAMKKASAIITNEGGTTSHAAIVSREIGTPCVVGTSKGTEIIDNEQKVTVDGDQGHVYSGIIEASSRQKQNEEAGTVQKPFIPIATKLYVNVSSPEGAQRAANQAVDGVGLLRAEFIAAQLGYHPKLAIERDDTETWIENYANNIRQVAEAFNPRPVIYRTLDFKTNEYRDLEGGEKYEPDEKNPMLGYRGCYRNNHDNEIFEMELTAIKRVREEYGLKNLHVMIPFVRTVKELEEVINKMNNFGLKRNRDFKLWIMVEVPSTVIRIEEFLEFVDGVSIGTNDLTQLILGVDRDNEQLSDIFDERDPAVLEAIRQVISACNAHNKTSSVCGQAPTKYEEIVQFLVDQGVTSMSVSPDAINKTRRTIARMEKKELLQNAIH